MAEPDKSTKHGRIGLVAQLQEKLKEARAIEEMQRQKEARRKEAQRQATAKAKKDQEKKEKQQTQRKLEKIREEYLKKQEQLQILFFTKPQQQEN